MRWVSGFGRSPNAGAVGSSLSTRPGCLSANDIVVAAHIDSPPTIARAMPRASMTAVMSSAIRSTSYRAGSVTG